MFGFAANTCVFALDSREWLVGHPTHHRPWLEATGQCFVAIGHMFGRSALFVVGRPCIWPIWHFWLADHCASAVVDIFMPAMLAGIHLFPPPYTCMEGFHSCQTCFVSFARVIFYKEEASPPSSRVTKNSSESSEIRVYIVCVFYLYFSLYFALSVLVSYFCA